MRQFCLVLVVIAVLSMAGVSYGEECTTLGAKDCKPSNQPGVCYWWECQQTGSVRQMIFLGQKCTCPRSRLDTGNARLAQLGDDTVTTLCIQPVSQPSE